VGNEYGKKATVKGLISTALAATTCSCMIGNGINCVYMLPDIITVNAFIFFVFGNLVWDSSIIGWLQFISDRSRGNHTVSFLPNSTSITTETTDD
jgi:hypothetical protein